MTIFDHGMMQLRHNTAGAPRKVFHFGGWRRFHFAGALAVALSAAWLSPVAVGQVVSPAGPWDTFSDTWVATDGLGRSLPSAAECGAPRKEKSVGIFYFLWLEGKGEVFDITKLRAANRAAPAYGPPKAFHFWGEPLFGYYRADDEFVIRKHAQMLTDAGVDVIIFDVTNGLIYEQICQAIFRVFGEMRKQGQRTPQISFIANRGYQRVVEELYRKFYAQNPESDLWFRWQDKPLMLSPSETLSREQTNFFTLRRSWAWSSAGGWFGDGRDKWPWIEHTPQKFGWHSSPDRPEQIAVAVATHPITLVGRSYHNGHEPPPGQRQPGAGLFFGEQWTRALEVNPEFIFVTGWNEWVAQRQVKTETRGPREFVGEPLPIGGAWFVDTFNQEFSRDIEPMQGGHGDNYYYQLASNVRRFKGARVLPPVASQPVQVDGRFDDWKEVAPEFRDTLGDPARRDHPGWKGQPQFVNKTGRNDLAAAKVSGDADKIYFYVRTAAPLTPSTGANWMLLFIDADHNPKTGWLGYDFVVNRSGVEKNATTLERNIGGKYEWGSPVEVAYRAAGNELELAIPRAALGAGTDAVTIDFKWADGIQQTGDWSDFTLNGDAAPNDRYNFRAMFPATSFKQAASNP